MVVDRPREAGGGGKGFNGGQLLNLAVAACISNDLYREAGARGVARRRVAVTVRSDYAGTPAASTPIAYDVAVEGEASEAELIALVGRIDAIAEIPNSLRGGTAVSLGTVEATSSA